MNDGLSTTKSNLYSGCLTSSQAASSAIRLLILYGPLVRLASLCQSSSVYIFECSSGFGTCGVTAATEDVSTTRVTDSASLAAIITFVVPTRAGLTKSFCGSVTSVQNGDAV